MPFKHIDQDRLKQALQRCKSGWNDQYNLALIEAGESVLRYLTSPTPLWRNGYWLSVKDANDLDEYNAATGQRVNHHNPDFQAWRIRNRRIAALQQQEESAAQ